MRSVGPPIGGGGGGSATGGHANFGGLGCSVATGQVRMLASLGVTQDGLNLPQLDTFVFFNRSYKAREEFQAMYRLLRPGQRQQVEGYFLHLKGSIDQYMAQLVDWKARVAEAGVDYGDQQPDQPFAHFDVFLRRFLDSLPNIRDHLSSLAAGVSPKKQSASYTNSAGASVSP